MWNEMAIMSVIRTPQEPLLASHVEVEVEVEVQGGRGTRKRGRSVFKGASVTASVYLRRECLLNSHIATTSNTISSTTSNTPFDTTSSITFHECQSRSSRNVLHIGDELIGRTVVDLSTIALGMKSVCGWYHLSDPTHTETGQIFLSVALPYSHDDRSDREEEVKSDRVIAPHKQSSDNGEGSDSRFALTHQHEREIDSIADVDVMIVSETEVVEEVEAGMNDKVLFLPLSSHNPDTAEVEVEVDVDIDVDVEVEVEVEEHQSNDELPYSKYRNDVANARNELSDFGFTRNKEQLNRDVGDEYDAVIEVEDAEEEEDVMEEVIEAVRGAVQENEDEEEEEEEKVEDEGTIKDKALICESYTTSEERVQGGRGGGGGGEAGDGYGDTNGGEKGGEDTDEVEGEEGRDNEFGLNDDQSNISAIPSPQTACVPENKEEEEEEVKERAKKEEKEEEGAKKEEEYAAYDISVLVQDRDEGKGEEKDEGQVLDREDEGNDKKGEEGVEGDHDEDKEGSDTSRSTSKMSINEEEEHGERRGGEKSQGVKFYRSDSKRDCEEEYKKKDVEVNDEDKDKDEKDEEEEEEEQEQEEGDGEQEQEQEQEQGEQQWDGESTIDSEGHSYEHDLESCAENDIRDGEEIGANKSGGHWSGCEKFEMGREIKTDSEEWEVREKETESEEDEEESRDVNDITPTQEEEEVEKEEEVEEQGVDIHATYQVIKSKIDVGKGISSPSYPLSSSSLSSHPLSCYPLSPYPSHAPPALHSTAILIQQSTPDSPEYTAKLSGHIGRGDAPNNEYDTKKTELASKEKESARIKQLVAEEVDRVVSEKFSSTQSLLRAPMHPILVSPVSSTYGAVSSTYGGSTNVSKGETVRLMSVCVQALDFKEGPQDSVLMGAQSKARLGTSSDAYTPGFGPRLIYSVDVMDTSDAEEGLARGQGQVPGQGRQGQGHGHEQGREQGGRASEDNNSRGGRSSGPGQGDYGESGERSREGSSDRGRGRGTQTSPRPLSDVIAMALSAIKKTKATNSNNSSNSSNSVEFRSSSPDMTGKSSARFPGRRRQFLDAETERISRIMLRTMSSQSS